MNDPEDSRLIVFHQMKEGVGEWLTYLANCNSVKKFGLRSIHPQQRPIEDFSGWLQVFKNNHLHDTSQLVGRRTPERCPSWLKERDWKSRVLLTVVPRVRIPLSPPNSYEIAQRLFDVRISHVL